ncbi:hypothetical protein [Lentibacillus sp. CBA3610]|uniref:hypothetical protein n=1 Tax=Lentibacillus sp. CBA3610 TaxID=2518176 RepID=UPI001595D86D|nr:hypothetical protein [Lentibacillus sp. CBA3610]
MTLTWVFVKIACIVLSIAAGLIFFNVSSPLSKSFKKQQLEESVSLIINLVSYGQEKCY